MNILDRWRVARLKRDLAILVAEDTRERDGETTVDLMNRIRVRAEKMMLLRLGIHHLEGAGVDVDLEDSDDTRTPSSLFCPTRPEGT